MHAPLVSALSRVAWITIAVTYAIDCNDQIEPTPRQAPQRTLPRLGVNLLLTGASETPDVEEALSEVRGLGAEVVVLNHSYCLADASSARDGARPRRLSRATGDEKPAPSV